MAVLLFKQIIVLFDSSVSSGDSRASRYGLSIFVKSANISLLYCVQCYTQSFQARYGYFSSWSYFPSPLFFITVEFS